MVLTDKQQFLDCIHYDEGGEYYARYNGLTLRSVFQPIFDKQHQVVGAEALVRFLPSIIHKSGPICFSILKPSRMMTNLMWSA